MPRPSDKELVQEFLDNFRKWLDYNLGDDDA